MGNRFDAIIIGGGITGLACAYKLSQRFERVAIIERNRSARLLQTKMIDGFQCETGPSVFVNKKGILNFIEEIGLGNEVIYPVVKRSGKYIWCNERVCKAPTNPVAFLSSPLFPDVDKLMLIRLIKALFIKGYLKPQSIDESVATFVNRIFGRRTIDRVIDPVLKGIFGGQVDRLSARSLFPSLWDVSISGGSLLDYLKQKESRGLMFVLKNGSESIINKLYEKLNNAVFVDNEVVEVGTSDDSAYQVKLSNGENLISKNIYVATSGDATASFIRNMDEDLANELLKLAYTAIVVAHCGVPRSEKITKAAYGVLFPEGTSSELLGVMYNSELFPHKAPTGYQLLTLCIGGRGKHDYVTSVSDEDIEQNVKFELANKLGLYNAKMLCITRHKRVIPQYELGHYKVIEKMKEFENRYQGIYFIGADIGGIAVPDRIRQAVNATYLIT